MRPTVSQNADAMDLSTYEVDEISFEDNYTKDTETSIKFDAARPTINLGGYIGELKIGSKYRSREKTATAASLFLMETSTT